MNSHLLTALSSKVAIGAGAAALAFGSAGAVLATQNIGSTSDDITVEETTDQVDETKTHDITTPVVSNDTDDSDDAAEDTTDSTDAEPTFSEQVRALAQDEDREGGIGKDVSKLAHERNAARDHADDDTDEADDTDESDDDADESDDDADDTEVEDHSGKRGRSAEHRPGSDD